MEIITEECFSLSLLAILSNFSSSITTSIIFYSIWNLLIGIFLSKFLSCLTIPLNYILISPQLVPFFICLSSYRYFTIFMSRCIPIFSWFLLLFTLPCSFFTDSPWPHAFATLSAQCALAWLLFSGVFLSHCVCMSVLFLVFLLYFVFCYYFRSGISGGIFSCRIFVVFPCRFSPWRHPFLFVVFCCYLLL